MFYIYKKIAASTIIMLAFFATENAYASQSNHRHLDANAIASILEGSKPEAKKESAKENSTTEDTSLYSFSMLIPINHYDQKNAITLVLQSPKGYRCLQPLNVLDSPIREFIPATDKDPYKWSEIITFNQVRGKGIKASQVTGNLKNAFNQHTTNLKILKDVSEKKDGYKTATIAASYTVNGRREVLMSKNYSGPADCGGIQYSIALENGITEEQALKKIEEFFSDKANHLMFHEIKSPNGMAQVQTPTKMLSLLKS